LIVKLFSIPLILQFP